jgi:hypothetical protein
MLTPKVHFPSSSINNDLYLQSDFATYALGKQLLHECLSACGFHIIFHLVFALFFFAFSDKLFRDVLIILFRISWAFCWFSSLIFCRRVLFLTKKLFDI